MGCTQSRPKKMLQHTNASANNMNDQSYAGHNLNFQDGVAVTENSASTEVASRLTQLATSCDEPLQGTDEGMIQLEAIRKGPKTTFLDLPAELRNEIYTLSGCLETMQCPNCTRTTTADKADEFFCSEAAILERVSSLWRRTFGTRPSGLVGSRYPCVCKSCEYNVDRDLRALRAWTCTLGMYHLAQRDDAFLHINRGSKWFEKAPKPQTDLWQRTVISDTWTGPMKATSQPSLTRVCRKIREDTLPMWYGNQHFLFTILTNKDGAGVYEGLDRTGEMDHHDDALHMIQWFERIGRANAAAIRRLTIVYTTVENGYYLRRCDLPWLKSLGVDVEGAVVLKRTEDINWRKCQCRSCEQCIYHILLRRSDEQEHVGQW